MPTIPHAWSSFSRPPKAKAQVLATPNNTSAHARPAPTHPNERPAPTPAIHTTQPQPAHPTFTPPELHPCTPAPQPLHPTVWLLGARPMARRQRRPRPARMPALCLHLRFVRPLNTPANLTPASPRTLTPATHAARNVAILLPAAPPGLCGCHWAPRPLRRRRPLLAPVPLLLPSLLLLSSQAPPRAVEPAAPPFWAAHPPPRLSARNKPPAGRPSCPRAGPSAAQAPKRPRACRALCLLAAPLFLSRTPPLRRAVHARCYIHTRLHSTHDDTQARPAPACASPLSATFILAGACPRTFTPPFGNLKPQRSCFHPPPPPCLCVPYPANARPPALLPGLLVGAPRGPRPLAHPTPLPPPACLMGAVMPRKPPAGSGTL